MKKVIKKGVAVLCTAALLGTSVFSASIVHNVEYDYSNNKAYINGTAPKGTKYVLMQVLKDTSIGEQPKDGTFVNMQAQEQEEKAKVRPQRPNYSNVTSFILWNGQAEVNEDGSFVMDIGVLSDLEAGYYDAYFSTEIPNSALHLTGENGLLLMGKDAYADAVEALNAAAGTEVLADFVAAIKGDEVSPLGVDTGLLESAGDAIAQRYMEYVKDNHLDATKSKDNAKMFNTYMMIGALENSAVDNVSGLMEKSSFAGTSLYTDYKNFVDTETEEKYFTSKLSGKAFADASALEKGIKETIILNQTKYADGYVELESAVTKYATAVGITATSDEEVYKSLIRDDGETDFANFEAFKTEYIRLTTSTPASDGNGGGTGGGGGGGGGGTARPSQNTGAISGSYETLPSVDTKPEKVEISFVDIEDVDWASEAIIALADKGVINGKGDGYFMPDDFVTREEFAKILVGALGIDETAAANNVFTDAKADDWFCKYINAAYKNGLVKGIGDGKFGVGQSITRQDMVVMTYNALKLKNAQLPAGELKFADSADIADYAKTAVGTLSKLGIVNGVSETEFAPLGTATRAQAAKVVYGILLQLQ